MLKPPRLGPGRVGFSRRSFVRILNLNLVLHTILIHTIRLCVHQQIPPHQHGTSASLPAPPPGSQTTVLTRLSGFIKSTRQACQSNQGHFHISQTTRAIPLKKKHGNSHSSTFLGSWTNWVSRWCHPSTRRVHGRHDANDHPKRQGSRSGRGHPRVVGKRARSPVSDSVSASLSSLGGRLLGTNGGIVDSRLR